MHLAILKKTGLKSVIGLRFLSDGHPIGKDKSLVQMSAATFNAILPLAIYIYIYIYIIVELYVGYEFSSQILNNVNPMVFSNYFCNHLTQSPSYGEYPFIYCCLGHDKKGNLVYKAFWEGHSGKIYRR